MRECDLILKGGITSGVVYPDAIKRITDDYRLRQIGGTSAGAIAAVFAAAAEYRRQRDKTRAGFDHLAQLAADLGEGMEHLFQPTPPLRPLFALFKAVISDPSNRLSALTAAIVSDFRGAAIAGFLGAAIGLTAFVFGAPFAGLLFLLAGAVGGVMLFLLRVWRLVSQEAPKAGFGICSGLRQTPDGRPALTEWITDELDNTAGRNPAADPPLTVGDLEGHGVKVSAMTTDVSSGRPYVLPFSTKIHYFSRSEFFGLFPARIVDYLCEQGEKRDPAPNDPDDIPRDLYQLPTGRAFPVALIARLSLSFPGLIAAPPLYRVDYTRKDEFGDGVMARCVFSDGGIASNFPVHFFDAPLPRRPTFGISLDKLDPTAKDQKRIHVTARNRQSTDLHVGAVKSVGAFLMSIVRTGMNWQDTLQSLLPGYADRIVTIRLDPKTEGGMHINMSRETVDTLRGLGEEAAETLLDHFDMEAHRYRRAMAILPKMEDALVDFTDAFDAPADAHIGVDYERLLKDEDRPGYKNPKDWRENILFPFADGLAALGRKATDQRNHSDAKSVAEGNAPVADARLRIVADADRRPEPTND